MKMETVFDGDIMEELLLEELALLQKLDHPHIVHVLEMLQDDENLYVVMELMTHGDLLKVHQRIIKNKWTFTERDIANIIRQILQALNYMHSQGVVHRDLKLENVMVDLQPTDEEGRHEFVCKLTDFGFSTIIEKG